MSKILIVDDEPTIVDLLEENLNMEGYDTVRAYTGEEAIQVMEKEPPDLVLLDLMLPGMDGYEVCRQMQKDVRLSQIPVIMLTAKSATSDRVAGFEKGADDYIVKPFDIDELLVRVRAQLHHLYHEARNELTGLPGSQAVEDAIKHRAERAHEPWTIIYIDIDYLDVYNEVYSFQQGDELIRLAGRVISDTVREYGNRTDFAGHVGGDNFVVISTPDQKEVVATKAKERFDAAVPNYYSPVDREHGHVMSIDRKGNPRQSPLSTLAFDFVDNVPEAATA